MGVLPEWANHWYGPTVAASAEAAVAAGLRRGNDPSKKAQTWWDIEKTWRDISAQDIEKARTAWDIQKAQKACDMQKEALLKVDAIAASPSWWTQCKAAYVAFVEDFNSELNEELLRCGLDPSVRTARAAFMEGWNEAKDRNMAKKKARDMDTMQKGRVDAGGTRTGTWPVALFRGRRGSRNR